jgi:hypothetical protein
VDGHVMDEGAVHVEDQGAIFHIFILYPRARLNQPNSRR